MQLRFKDVPIRAKPQCLNASVELGAGGMRAQPVNIYIYIYVEFDAESDFEGPRAVRGQFRVVFLDLWVFPAEPLNPENHYMMKLL